jgi:hypothetical protein
MKLPEKIQCLDYLNLLSIFSRILLRVLKWSQLTFHVSSTKRNLPINNALTCKKQEKTKLLYDTHKTEQQFGKHALEKNTDVR